MDPLLQHPTASPGPRHENPCYGVCFSSLTCAENGGSIQNCLDLRNFRVADIVAEINAYNCDVDVYDPWVKIEDARQEHGITTNSFPIEKRYDAIVLSVAHDAFRDMGVNKIRSFGKETHVVYNVKWLFSKTESDFGF